MISIRVTSIGDTTPARLAGMLASFDQGIRDWTPAWPKVIERFRAQERRRFATGNAEGPSGRWAPLKPGYAARKRLLFAQRPILYLSGLLMDSLAGDGSGSLVQYDSKSIFMGTTVPYAIHHQTGTPVMARRPVIDPSARDVSEYVTEIWRYIEGVKSRAGFRGSLAGMAA